MQNGVAGEEGAISFYRALKSTDDRPVKYDLGERHLTAAGHALIQYNMIDRAIELFTFMVEEFQQSSSAYSTLADAHVKAGNKELAKENYRKSLELNPGDENVKKKLQQL
jgi:tetratricopeptide (TPR) repeat protein